MSEPVRLILQPPTPQAPGFLRRTQKVLAIQRAVAEAARVKDPTALLEVFADLADFLLPFVVEPTDRGAAREALLDASQEQLMAALHAVGNPPSQPEQSGARSDAG